MLKAAAQGPILGPSNTEIGGEAGGGRQGSAGEAGARPNGGSTALAASLATVERLAGLGPIAARSVAMLAMSERDAAFGQITRVEPPAITADAFCGHLRLLLAQLRALRASGLPRAA